MLAVSINLFSRLHGDWFPALLLLPIFVPGFYYLFWLFIVGPLNEALGVEGSSWKLKKMENRQQETGNRR